MADNLSRATMAVPEDMRSATGDATTPHQRALAALYEGVVMTEEILQVRRFRFLIFDLSVCGGAQGVLKRQSVSRFRPVAGDAFDPTLHNAMFRVPSAHHAPNTIAVVQTDGYTIHDRVLRAAAVGVHEAPEQ